MEGGRSPMVIWSGNGRPGSYRGSSGPRHSSQTAIGAGARSAPQARQRSGRAVSGGETMADGVASIRFLAPCLTWRQYAPNHHESSIVNRKYRSGTGQVNHPLGLGGGGGSRSNGGSRATGGVRPGGG